MTFHPSTATREQQAQGQNIALELLDVAAAAERTLDNVRVAGRVQERVEFQRLLTQYARFCSALLPARSTRGKMPHQWGLPFEPELDQLDLTASTSEALAFHQLAIYDGAEELVEDATVLVPRAYFLDPQGWLEAEQRTRITRDEAIRRDQVSRTDSQRQQAVNLLEGLGWTVSPPKRPEAVPAAQ